MRPAAPPDLVDRRVVVTADVGGTFVKSGILGPAGLVALRRDATDAQRGGEAVGAAVASTLRRHADDARRAGLEPIAGGVAVTGIVDEANGVIVRASAIDWSDFPIGGHLAETLGLPVVISHDVRAGGRAEARCGAAAGRPHSLFVALGTGIAAAVVTDGAMLTGSTFHAGEIGQHLVPDPDEPARLTPLEAVASAGAIGHRYRALGGGAATAADVAALVGSDPLAARVWGTATAALAEVLALAIAVLDPDVVVIGGGLADAGSRLLDPLAESLRTRLGWREMPPLAIARFGVHAGLVGAALAAWSATAGDDAHLAASLATGWEADGNAVSRTVHHPAGADPTLLGLQRAGIDQP